MNHLLHLSSKIATSLLVLAILTLSAPVLAQNYENFDNLPLGSTPGSGSYIGNSVPWYYYNCRGDVPMTGKAITLGVGGTTSSLTSYNLPPDIQTISFDLMQVGSGAATVFVLVDGDQVDALTTSVQGLTVNSGPISFSTAGVEEVEIVFITAEGGNEVAIDNINWSVTYTPDNLETFDNLEANPDYFAYGEFTGVNNHQWVYSDGMLGEMDGNAIILKKYDEDYDEDYYSQLWCEDISNGMYSLNFDYWQNDFEDVQLDIYINGNYLAGTSASDQFERMNTGEIIVDIAGDEYTSLTLLIINSGGEVTIDNIAWTNQSYNYTTFTGTGDWSDASKWDNGIPNKNSYAFIDGHATIDVEATAHYVGVEPQWTLTLEQNTLTSKTLSVRSDANGSGSFIGSSSDLNITNANVNWHISSGVPKAWHLLSSPNPDEDLTSYSNVFAPYTSGYDFYAWDEPNELWLNQKVLTHNINSFTPGKGYLVAYEDISKDKNFNSTTFNSGTISIPVTASSGGIFNGYNLIGNPYPSSIDWKSTALDKSHLKTENDGYTLYIWNDAEKNYGAYNDATTGDIGTNEVGRYIPPLQGFFVWAQTNGNFVFNDGARVHSSQQYMKSGNQEGFSLSVTAPENAGKDEILLDFGHENNQGGAEKWYSMNATAPSLYVPTAEKDYSISFLTTTEDNPIVPIAFKAGLDGEYSIQAEFNTAAFSSVKLMDQLSNTVHELNGNSTYSFTATTDDDPNRFKLSFGFLGINNPDAAAGVHVYTYDNLLYIETPSSEVASVNVHNALGQLVMQARTAGNTLSSFNVSTLGTGVYVVNVSLNQAVVSQKVVINK